MKKAYISVCIAALISILLPSVTAAQEEAQENASNPLAATNNVDFRWQRISTDSGTKRDYFVDGAYMIFPTLKLKYELHYNENDFTGTSQKNLEKLVIKPLFFFGARKLSDSWAVKYTVGADWILDLGDTSKAIGIGSDQIAPLGGAAFSHIPSGLVLIPLAQHFVSYNGPTDVDTTSIRLIALKPFGKGYWAKADLKFPYDWHTNVWSPSAELQVGYNVNQRVAVYAEGLVGLGSYRTYNQGIGFGLRIKY